MGMNNTVAELYETYLSQQIEDKKRSAREFDRVFRKYIEPELGDRIADSITRGDVSRFVEEDRIRAGQGNADDGADRLSPSFDLLHVCTHQTRAYAR